MVNDYLKELATETGRTVMEMKDRSGAGKTAFIDGLVSQRELRGMSSECYFFGVNYWEEYDATQFTALPKELIDHGRATP